MNVADARRLFAYDEWANERLLGCAAGLDSEPLTRGLGGSFGSIRDTLLHLVLVEWVWLRRWQGESPRQEPDWAAAPSVASLRTALSGVEAERRAFLDGLRDEDLARVVEYTLFAGEAGRLPLGELLIHAVNHSTYHRGQVAMMLRMLGATPPATDFDEFRGGP